MRDAGRPAGRQVLLTRPVAVAGNINMTIVHGVFSVLPTPFTPDDRVDTDSLKRVVDLYLAAGVNGLTILGLSSFWQYVAKGIIIIAAVAIDVRKYAKKN